MEILKYSEKDLPEMIEIWNEVVKSGDAFPQENGLDIDSGKDFFAKQDFTGIAKLDGRVVGLYILHPNNVGRCSHQANASYAVRQDIRGKHIGEALVKHSLEAAAKSGYKLLIFNAVVKGNDSAVHLYEKLGFVRIGEVPGGYKAKNGEFLNTYMYYHKL